MTQYRETKKKFWVRRGEKIVNRYEGLEEAAGEAARLWTWDRENGFPFTQLTVGTGEGAGRRTAWWNGRDISKAQHVHRREEKEYESFQHGLEFAS